MTNPGTGAQEGTGDEPVPSLRSGDEQDHEDEPISIPDEWMEMLVAILNRLDYGQAVQAWNEADAFQSHILDHWADESERHMERLAEEGRYGR